MDFPKIIARPFLAGAMIVGSFFLYYTVSQGACNAEWRDIVNIIVGALVSNLTTIVAFYFGSSSGSEAKTEIMAESMRNGKNP